MRIIYTPEQRETAIATYRRLGSFAQTIRVLGYPSRHVLHDWVREGPPSASPRAQPRPPLHYPWEFTSAAVHRVAEGESVKNVGADLSMTTHVVLYGWVQQWRMHGDRGLMSKREQARADGLPTRASLERSLPDDVAELKRLAAELMVEKAVLERKLELAEKDEGVIPTQLSNLQKTQVVEALRQLFPLRLLLEFARLQPSSYQYCRQVLDRPQAHVKLRAMIRDIASASSYTHGSPRVWLALRKSGTQLSEKVARRLMKEERIPVFYARRKRRYSSYEGKLTPAPIDQVNRKFHANEPNRLWVTDVSEFPAPDGKVYLSPMIDCFDGKIVSWQMRRSPNEQLTQGTLEDAIHTLPESYRAELRAQENPSRLTIHTDRGGHYRGGEWIEGMKSAGLTRAMGGKGNSGDNAACEGFFGRMKTEMLYGRTWKTANQIESAISAYMHFYNNTRIKTVLGGAAIAEYREALEAEPSKEQSYAPLCR